MSAAAVAWGAPFDVRYNVGAKALIGVDWFESERASGVAELGLRGALYAGGLRSVAGCRRSLPNGSAELRQSRERRAAASVCAHHRRRCAARQGEPPLRRVSRAPQTSTRRAALDVVRVRLAPQAKSQRRCRRNSRMTANVLVCEVMVSPRLLGTMWVALSCAVACSAKDLGEFNAGGGSGGRQWGWQFGG